MQKLWSNKELASGQNNNPWKQNISAQDKHTKSEEAFHFLIKSLNYRSSLSIADDLKENAYNLNLYQDMW